MAPKAKDNERICPYCEALTKAEAMIGTPTCNRCFHPLKVLWQSMEDLGYDCDETVYADCLCKARSVNALERKLGETENKLRHAENAKEIMQEGVQHMSARINEIETHELRRDKKIVELQAIIDRLRAENKELRITESQSIDTINHLTNDLQHTESELKDRQRWAETRAVVKKRDKKIASLEAQVDHAEKKRNELVRALAKIGLITRQVGLV